jgi:hypothetical protein
MVDFDPYSPVGFSVDMTAFDRDGWQRGRFYWFHGSEKEPLLEFISSNLEIPEDEAHQLTLAISEDWLHEWERRLAKEYKTERRVEKWLWWGAAGVGAIVLLALWGLVRTVWLLVS